MITYFRGCILLSVVSYHPFHVTFLVDNGGVEVILATRGNNRPFTHCLYVLRKIVNCQDTTVLIVLGSFFGYLKREDGTNRRSINFISRESKMLYLNILLGKNTSGIVFDFFE